MEPVESDSTIKLKSEPEPPPEPPRPQVLARIRAWLRSRKGRVIFPIATFAAGMVTALLIIVLVFTAAKDVPPISTPGSSSQGNIVIQIGPSYITHIVARSLPEAGMPGTVKNVRVTLARGDQMNVDGDDEFSLIGLGFTEHFTIILQPYVHNCQLQIRVLHADLSNIPVTGFVASFESEINQQLQVKSSDFPKGFVYCNTAVRTDPTGLFITYTATPV